MYKAKTTVTPGANQTKREWSGEDNSGPWKQWHCSRQIPKQSSYPGTGLRITKSMWCCIPPAFKLLESTKWSKTKQCCLRLSECEKAATQTDLCCVLDNNDRLFCHWEQTLLERHVSPYNSQEMASWTVIFGRVSYVLIGNGPSTSAAILNHLNCQSQKICYL